MNRRIKVLSVLVILLIGIVVFSFRGDLARLISQKSIKLRYCDLLSACESFSVETVVFQEIREHGDTKQILFGVSEKTSGVDLDEVMMKTKIECEKREIEKEIWQIIFCPMLGLDCNIGEAYAVLTNQSALSGESSNKMENLHLCRLNLSEKNELESLRSYYSDYVKELILYGTFSDIDTLRSWSSLRACIYSSVHIITGKIYDTDTSFTKDEWNQRISSSDLQVLFVSDLNGDRLIIPEINWIEN